MRRHLITGSMLLVVALPALGQLAVPRVSPKATVAQTIGTTEITIEYHRPGVKNREIWGGLVPYGQPWRMGANEATTISFTHDVRVEGNDVPAGTYSFFAIPGRERWTLVLNRDPEQWGAYGYDESKDQLRVEVTPAQAPHTEWMRFTIDPVTPASAVVKLNWERLAVPMNIEVDVSKIVWADVDKALAAAPAEEARRYGTAASWALESGERLEEGLEWIDRSIAIREDVFNLWTKARILQKLGRSREALPVMERSLSMARGNMPPDFIQVLEAALSSIRNDIR